MRSRVIIEKHGDHYTSSVYGKYGGGHTRAHAGKTAGEAASRAANFMVCFCRPNDEGGDLIAPQEILDLVPANLHQIKGR